MRIFEKNAAKSPQFPGLRLQTPTSVILHCEFFSLHLPTKAQILLESTKRPSFLVIIVGVLSTQKKLCCISYATDYGRKV